MDGPKLTKYSDGFPKISADKLLELLRELRQTTTSTEQQVENSCEIKPCVQLLASTVDYLDAGRADNVIDKFVLSVCARVGVQFIGNAIVGNEENKKLLWNHSELLRKIFCYNDTKLKNYISMVYYNVMLSNSAARREMLEDDIFMTTLLDEAILGLSEFPQFMLEKFLEFDFYEKLYTGRKVIHKIYLLDLLLSLLNRETDFRLGAKDVDKIASDFKLEAEYILNGPVQKVQAKNSAIDMVNGEKLQGTDIADSEKREVKENGENGEKIDDEPSGKLTEEEMIKRDFTGNPRLTVKLLTTLCSLSINDNYKKIISDNTSLLIDAIYVLRALHMAETSRSGNHTPLESTESDQPIIGFKADLIRLIGNLCWKHKTNQDLVRENHCIELLLNHCKLDERNPFIGEWSILAIKNLVDGNQENAEYIGSLKRTVEPDIVVMAENMKLDPNQS